MLLARHPADFSPSSSFPSTDYHPTSLCYLKVLYTLTHHISPPLPPELALEILDFAFYYPRIHAESTQYFEISNSSSHDGCAYAVLVSPPVRTKVMRVKWTIKSCDQGWSGETLKGTYRHSWTWFEAAILRHVGACPSDAPDVPELKLAEEVKATGRVNVTIPGSFPEAGWEEVGVEVEPRSDGGGESVSQATKRKTRWHVQRNVNTSSQERVHVIEWSVGDGCATELEEDPETGQGSGKEYIHALHNGDRLCLFARARVRFSSGGFGSRADKNTVPWLGK
jgi:hypothetical protein